VPETRRWRRPALRHLRREARSGRGGIGRRGCEARTPSACIVGLDADVWRLQAAPSRLAAVPAQGIFMMNSMM
jgi:hypothetical protein